METSQPKSSVSKSTRYAALLLPPLGLVRLWLEPHISFVKKLLGSLWIIFYCVPYALIIIAILCQFFGLQVEFRGGTVPRLTFHKTVPNFDALEADRAKQAQGSLSEARSSTNVATPYWTGFRGPNRDGHYDEHPILTNWPPGGPRRLWRQPIGGGYSSFAVANGLAYTIEQRRKQEAVTAYDVETGREVWAHLYDSLFVETLGGDGPRATPAFHEGRVYSLGALGQLHCLDAASGRLIWRHGILFENEAKLMTYGVSASPLIVDGKVIVQSGGVRGQSVVAYDQNNGERVWSALDDEAAYSSPMLVNLAGQRQLLVVCQNRALGLAVENGKVLWDHPWTVLQGNRNIAQPVLLGTNRFFLSAGYGTGCEAVEVVKSGSGFAARTVWKNKFLKNKFTSSVFWNGNLYGLDEDILTCLDAQTGERKWKEGRYGYGQLLLASDHLIIMCGDGDLALVKATPERHEEVGRFSAIEGKTWNHPALANGRLLVRNAVEMACFDISGE